MGEKLESPEQRGNFYAGDTFGAIAKLPETALNGARNVFQKLADTVRERI